MHVSPFQSMCHHSEHDLENDITSRERHVFSRRPRTYIMSALSISILLAPTAILGVTATPAVTHPPQGRTLVNALAADLGTTNPPSTSVPACTDWGIRRTIVIINMTSFFYVFRRPIAAHRPPLIPLSPPTPPVGHRWQSPAHRRWRLGGCVGRSSCQPRPRGPLFLRLWEAASLSEHDTCRVRENDSMGCIHT